MRYNFRAANMSIGHKLLIDLDSVEPGLRSSTLEAGTQLRYLPWMGVVRGFSSNMEGRGLSANMEGSFQGGY